ncbi:MAG TPA: MFS transporter [Usitatibacter sp.]|jgi:MFS family permease|nr:MFS transporter [Usitatibacter sp.]
MSCASIAPEPAVAPPKAGLVSGNAAFHLQASITVSLMASSSAPTPLYPLYQSLWGFTPVTTTIVFAVYAIAVLASLLVAGRLSDHVGRRPVLLTAIAVQIATMGLFVTAQGVGQLIAARIIQGLSTGAAVAAIGAGLLDLDKARGAVANALTTPIGTALGALAAGVMVQYLPHPTHLVYALLAAVMVVQAAGVTMMAETRAPRAGAWASLKPRLSLPRATRESMLLAGPALVAAWSIAGFYASLSPALIRGMLHTSSPLVGALGLVVLAGSAAIATLALRDKSPRVLNLVGGTLVLAGVALALGALSLGSPTAFFAGSSLAGMGFGAGFQGAIRSLAAAAPAHERAGVLSIAFIVSYLAMGLPAIVAGYLVTRQGDLVTTAREFGAFVAALAIVSLASVLMRNPGRSRIG